MSAKGISGGYLPLSLVMTRNSIYQTFYSDSVARGFLHSHSHTGNPLACRAALGTLAIFEDDNVLAQNQVRAKRLTLGSARTLYFCTGYMTNLGIVSALANSAQGDITVLSKSLNHASLIGGIRLSHSSVQMYPHCDTQALSDLLKVSCS